MSNAELTAYKLARGQKKALARKHLKELIDAERYAELAAEREGHDDYADWLKRDYDQNEKIYNQKRMPTWAANEYSYNTLYQPRKPAMRKQMSEAEKLRLKKDRKAMKLIREQSNIPKIINPKTGREVYVDSAIGQKILKARSVLQRLAPSRGEALYSNIQESRANRSGLSLGPEARSIAAASRSGRNPLGISDAQLIAALESGDI
jgi:hypothetical protein